MKKIFVLSIIALASVSLSAQEKGYLTGSLESNNHFYMEDKAINFKPSDDKFGSNNYLKMDYYNGNFSAGLQLEAYLPSIIGLEMNRLDKYAISNLYVNWKDEDFQITAGTFYDQFGSGLLFRSWEDRLLGLNNAIMGARFAYNWEDKIAFKAIWGMPRLGMEFSDTQVRGADLSISLANIIGLNDIVLSVEGSVLNKYDTFLKNSEVDPNTYGWSGRLNFDYDGFFVKGEYVDVGKKMIFDEQKRGNAQLIEAGYNGKGLGVTVTGRRLEYMVQSITYGSSSPANLISYVPAMSTQYTYMLTTLHPYTPLLGDDSTPHTSGEIGGQINAFYNFRRGTAIGGKRGMKIHANFSTYYTLYEEGTAKAGNLLLRDFSFDIEKQWTKKFKMVAQYSMQEYSPVDHGASKTTSLSHIGVADLLYKWTNMFSTRLELQYLHTKEDDKDWMAALLEVNFAPHWSFWASDMYNHGSTKVHYYNAGVSYTKGRTRLAAGYGRYKDGLICSGGVCRRIPQYTGANFSITTSF